VRQTIATNNRANNRANHGGVFRITTLIVILSEAKNLSSMAAIKEGFFASLRMTAKVRRGAGAKRAAYYRPLATLPPAL
jgi:hypothetical protein